MGVDPFERNWMVFSIALLLVFFALVTIAGFALGFQVPGVETRVDPETVADSGAFSQPGLRMVSEGEYEAHVVARTFTFEPRELEVPVGSKVTIYVTSVDVQHGFKIQDTNVNMQIVPGQVSKLSYTFDEIGEFPYICTEYCGLGHAAMYGVVNVVAAGGGE
jgi:cytochrome c oxidase subunit 2